jgi:hypothetical protein
LGTTEIEETFRNSNILISTIKELQQKQEESLFEIQFKLNQINRVKDNLDATNNFKPNFSPFNQEEETSLFGWIKLNQYSNMNLFKSQILTNERLITELLKLCEFSPNDKWSLLYRVTRDGFGSKYFHSRCDGHLKTIFKAKESSHICGGLTTVDWESSANGKWKSDPKAFIFRFTNKDNQPVKMKVKVDPNQQRAINCYTGYGPKFGGDIHKAKNATMYSLSHLGVSYSHPQYAEGTNEAKTFLAGTGWFQLDEIEVYQKE